MSTGIENKDVFIHFGQAALAAARAAIRESGGES